jgi:hypothetical protein
LDSLHRLSCSIFPSPCGLRRARDGQQNIGPMVSTAIRSVAATKPQEVDNLLCPSSFTRSAMVRRLASDIIVRRRILRAGLLRNPPRNIARGIPNVLLFISCLRLTLTAMSAPAKNASNRDRGLYGRWLFALLRSFFPAGGSREVSRACAARNAGRNICWHIPDAPGISVRAVRPNAPSSLPKNFAARFWQQFRTVIGPFRFRASCAGCSSANARCWDCFPRPPMPRY